MSDLSSNPQQDRADRIREGFETLRQQMDDLRKRRVKERSNLDNTADKSTSVPAEAPATKLKNS